MSVAPQRSGAEELPRPAAHMEAAWIDRWDGPLRIGARPAPSSPGSQSVLVNVEACGVGLTVLNCLRGDLASRDTHLPRIPGHEVVGRIVDVGAAVDPARLGERVMAYFYLHCGRCRMCIAACESMCQRLAGYVGVDLDGGYAKLATLPARNALAIPADIDPSLATAIPDAIATPVHVARRGGIGPGDRVAVVASGGGVGIHMVQVARLYGAAVAGLDVPGPKLDFLGSHFEVEPVDSSDFSRIRLQAGWGEKADVIIDLLGSEESLAWALAALAPNGRLVLLTTFRDRTTEMDPRRMVLGQGSVLGSRYASRAELAHASDLVQTSRVRPVVSRRVPLRDVESVHDELRNGTLLGRGAVVWDTEEPGLA